MMRLKADYNGITEFTEQIIAKLLAPAGLHSMDSLPINTLYFEPPWGEELSFDSVPAIYVHEAMPNQCGNCRGAAYFAQRLPFVGNTANHSCAERECNGRLFLVLHGKGDNCL